MAVVISNSPDETEALGACLANFLSQGDFVALWGDLGAGKTSFAKGVAKGLGVDPSNPVTSPTYTLMNIYQGRLPLFHFDLYRLFGDEDVVDLGFTEYFSGDGVSLIEWPDRLSQELPAERIDIMLSYIDETVRKIELVSSGIRFRRIIDELAPRMEKACKHVKFL
jgi:tRNA threonylcarbamoyladenosine biosynthesis protein TsaE